MATVTRPIGVLGTISAPSSAKCCCQSWVRGLLIAAQITQRPPLNTVILNGVKDRVNC